ncbi:MAG: hypothetical protein GX242_03700 [Clostridiales bacterium]|nr:hypothetical protein [Clostridiales bacterium]
MKKYCLIGKKLTHSYSCQIHKEFGYNYDLVEVKEDELKEFVKAKKYNGFNVTIPYKNKIIGCLDYVDDLAKEIDAVNTVKYIDGKSYGYNTDIYGMDYALKSNNISLKGKKVIILGSGGTAKTAKALAKLNLAKEIVIVGRESKVNYNNLHEHYNGQVIINTTPVGMYPNNGQKQVDILNFTHLESVFDAIYNPIMTPLIFDAKKLGIKYASGLKMLVAQAKAAKDIFLGQSAPDLEIEKIYKKLYLDIINIVLIGMPSSGKTTLACQLAKLLNKKFVDTDRQIEKLAGKSISEIFEKDGELYFRQMERGIISRFGKEHSQVIATGGGAVEGHLAYENLKQNGIIIFVKRDLAKTETKGRPLLAKNAAKTIKKLYQKRLPFYNQFADIIVNNDGAIADTLKTIMEKIYENISC